MPRQSFYLSVASAKEQRSEKYADNYYGPGMYEVKASYRGVDLIKVVVPTDVVDEMISLGLRLRDTLAPGIDAAEAAWEAEEAARMKVEEEGVGSEQEGRGQ